MLPNSSNVAVAKAPKPRRRWGWLIALPAWVLIGFALVEAALTGLIYLLDKLGVPFAAINQSVLQSIFAACVYVLTLVVVVGVPWLVKKYKTTLGDIGLSRLPSWMDIALAPAGFVVYLLVASIVIYVAGLILPGFNAGQAQEVGFANIAHTYEYILAFLTLVVIAPFAEEVLFRGFLYGKLRKVVPIWLAMLVTSALFGMLHGQWNVGLDVFVLSMVMCSLREVTGSIWAGVLLHMIKNGVAFYVLFINTALSHTIGG